MSMYFNDAFLTGNFGNDSFAEMDNAVCHACSAAIYENEECFDVDDVFFCKDCEEFADDYILSKVKDKYRCVFERSYV